MASNTFFGGEDLQLLCALLDKNSTFQRPSGQSVGYSLDHDDATASNRLDVGVHCSQVAAPAALPLPPLVVDKQLGLPAPSASKELRKMQAATSEEGPHGAVRDQRVIPAAAPSCTDRGDAAATGVSAESQPPRSVAAAVAKVEPVHSVLHMQHVSAEDIYLGMDIMRDNSSACSDGVVVKVDLPDHVGGAGSIVIDMEPLSVTVQTDVYALRAPLPRRVLKDKVRAQWDAAKKRLTLTLQTDPKEHKTMLV